MRSATFLRLLPVLLLALLPARAQDVNLRRPEEVHAQQPSSPDDMRARASNVQLQKDAKELAELCGSVPADMDSLKQGLLSKETIEKLKRMEKLSKRVREQLLR